MTDEMTMTSAVIECILSRSATKYYDPAATLSDDQIRELVRIATTAPTSFHLQNWRFIAVHTSEAKARLRPIAWDQPATTDAAVTFIVCGQLADSSVIPARLAPLVEAGIMTAKMVPEWEIPARNLYMKYPQRQRDEAVRTATFGAAAMIYAARSLGLGFDADDRFRCRCGAPRVRTGQGRSAGHAVVRRGGTSGKLAAEAAPSRRRCAGPDIVSVVTEITMARTALPKPEQVPADSPSALLLPFSMAGAEE
jgi:nitroreductase